MIDVHLYGKLRRFTGDSNPRRESVLPMEARERETISDIIRRIGIPPEELGSNIFLNGEVSALNRTVRDGDRLGIFPDDMQLLYRQYFPRKDGGRGMIRVECRLYAALRKYAPDYGLGEAMELELPDETTLAELYELLKVPPEEVKRTFVNGLSKAPSHALSDGDRVALFPPIGGG